MVDIKNYRIVSIQFRCPKCNHTKLQRTYYQLLSSPPWDTFQCKQCKELWAINCFDIKSYSKNVLMVKDGVIYRQEWLPEDHISLDDREEVDYSVYQSDKYKSGPAVGFYELQEEK